ncbi:MAG: 2-C-methyl-D-erythritol 4-phosphate cytidylyltransferase [Desulfopila sp.]
MTRYAAAIIPAAGSGRRMKSSRPKQYLELVGIPVLIHTVTAFHRHPDIAVIVVVVPPEWLAQTRAMIASWHQDDKVIVITGGLRRQDSVKAGVDFLITRCSTPVDTVLVHDGARPFISRKLIGDCLYSAEEHGAAIAAIPVKDTLKKGDADNRITATIDRTDLWQAQTPQAAKLSLLRQAFDRAGKCEFTDEASLLEHAGCDVQLVAGSETNIKITRPEDMILARKIVMPQNVNHPRIGHGFDAHTFCAGRDLILGGVTIDHHEGLAGHSDADVLTHALCDAILGALGKDDIGHHFPDSSAAFKDISSITLLETVTDIMFKDGFYIGNADITVVCQAPRLASFLGMMRQTLGRACRAAEGAINVKATTTEKMGYTGRKEGIGCHAVVFLIPTEENP